MAGGATVIQYREKELTFQQMLKEATQLQDIIRKQNRAFIINDRVDLAYAVKADGVHLGRDDMPVEIAREMLGEDAIIGSSVQSVSEAVEAQTKGADYLGASGVFPTSTKPDVGAVLGLENLERIVEAVTIPVVAIGGINLDNVASVIEAGAQGAAVISFVVGAADITETCLKLIDRIRRSSRLRE